MVALYADLLTVRGPADSKVECRYSDWSSCSYYCGGPAVEKRYKTLVDASPKESRAMCPLPEEAECGNITCTGKNAQISTNNLSLQDPFVFGDWELTDLCTETCGEEGKLLEKRTCTPTHPDKSCANLPTNQTLRAGEQPCGRKPCKGD